MATDGLVALVEDGARLENGLGIAEEGLDHPQLLVPERDIGGIQLGVGAEDPLPVEAGLLLHLRLIDREPAPTRKVTPVALVADERLGSSLERFTERPEDGFAVGLVLGSLIVVQADDVAVVVHPHLLDLER